MCYLTGHMSALEAGDACSYLSILQREVDAQPELTEASPREGTADLHVPVSRQLVL